MRFTLHDFLGKLPDLTFTSSGKASIHAKAAAMMQERVIEIQGTDGRVWDVYPDGKIEKRYKHKETDS